MKNTFRIVVTILLFTVLLSCKQQQARMPVSRSSGTFMKESIARNKKLIAGEEAKIDSIIKSNPQTKYIASKKGYWYHYEVRNERDTLRPKKGDIAQFEYEIKDFEGNVVYSEVELRPQTYVVDKQNIMMGLRDGIKLMRKNERVTFLFPSHMAYGYHGDNKRIGSNQPLICTVTLNDFKPETQLKTAN
ncbi:MULTISPECIES: gliding motility-associated peptidyl-prolyl isomerase GldI [Flavobacterium]|uniref:Peptidyl-prolyl cis-trans isomerase n=1 Tax=Flavobacterium sedimenticola TaxID=3043286 RepID=A0ABT6XR68_9FLAO|nr:gliding motility-associated peptidyl-prolyl isomerase GldI [Flavobacterium sedimenticola]MDI9257556.1 gliding motility-associated peptidyl-prolyl isomerase GldI [Flavobacterium sedimenticola]